MGSRHIRFNSIVLSSLFSNAQTVRDTRKREREGEEKGLGSNVYLVSWSVPYAVNVYIFDGVIRTVQARSRTLTVI